MGEEDLRGEAVSPREFVAGLGRLGFAATALLWEKPFLGPLYVWADAIRAQPGKVTAPWAVLVILDWIAHRLENGGAMEEVEDELVWNEKGPAIYTDAKATDTQAWIGGFLEVDEDRRKCPWFSLEVSEVLAPWLKHRQGNPKRVIASLELLATLMAVKLWGPGQKRSTMRARLLAFTDNQGNAFALKKGMSTRYPITLLLMELAEEMRAIDLRLDLIWVKREENEDADSLTNEDFEKFEEEMRVKIDEKQVQWRILDRLYERSSQLFEEVKSLKEKKRAEKPTGGVSKRRKILERW